MSADSDRVFVRSLVAAMEDDVGQPPETLLARVLGETENVRPRPRLVALVTHPPMVMPPRVVVGVRRSRLLLLAAALLVGLSLVASSLVGGPLPSPFRLMPATDSLDGLRSSGVLRVGIAPAGMSTAAGDDPREGFETDVARELADRLGLRAEIVPVEPLTLESNVTAWDITLPAVPEWTLDRDALVVTSSYYAWPRAVLAPTESGATSLADVQGQPICAVAGDAGQEWLLGEFGPQGASPPAGPPIPSTLIVRDSDAECLEALESGLVRAVVTATMSPADVAARADLTSVAEVPPEPRALVVPRAAAHADALVVALEDALEAMRDDGTLSGFATRWFGADLTSQR